MGIGFIALRRRFQKPLDEVSRTPASAWRRIELESVSRQARLVALSRAMAVAVHRLLPDDV